MLKQTENLQYLDSIIKEKPLEVETEAKTDANILCRKMPDPTLGNKYETGWFTLTSTLSHATITINKSADLIFPDLLSKSKSLKMAFFIYLVQLMRNEYTTIIICSVSPRSRTMT